MHGSDHFFTTLTHDSGTTVLSLHGELDLATAPHLTRRLRVLNVLPGPIQVDLSGLTFVDCAGVRPLLEARRALRCVDARPAIRDALRMMAAGELIDGPAQAAWN